MERLGIRLYPSASRRLAPDETCNPSCIAVWQGENAVGRVFYADYHSWAVCFNSSDIAKRNPLRFQGLDGSAAHTSRPTYKKDINNFIFCLRIEPDCSRM